MKTPGFTAEASLGQSTTHYFSTSTGSSTIGFHQQANIELQGFWEVLAAIGEGILAVVEEIPLVGRPIHAGHCYLGCLYDGGGAEECYQRCS